MAESWQTCIHRADGLCPGCQAQFDYDISTWIEYGHHSEGIERWRQLQAELDEIVRRLEQGDDE